MAQRATSSSARGCSARATAGAAARSRPPRAAAPPFRFSRMGPRGISRQLGEPNRKKIGVAMTAGGGGPSQIPAGFTYLGQFVDHDLTFDNTERHARARTSRRRSCCRRARPASTSTRSTAPARTTRSAKFYEADGVHLKMGKTVAADGDPAMDGFDLPRGAGHDGKAKRKAIIPDPRNDENLAVAQTHLAFIRFHNRVVDTLPASVPPAQRFAQARELVDQALPVDAPHRLPAADLRAGRRERRLHQRPQGVRGRRHPDRRADDADRVLGRRLPARALA